MWQNIILLTNIPLYGCATFYLPVHPVDGYLDWYFFLFSHSACSPNVLFFTVVGEVQVEANGGGFLCCILIQTSFWWDKGMGHVSRQHDGSVEGGSR